MTDPVTSSRSAHCGNHHGRFEQYIRMPACPSIPLTCLKFFHNISVTNMPMHHACTFAGNRSQLLNPVRIVHSCSRLSPTWLVSLLACGPEYQISCCLWFLDKSCSPLPSSLAHVRHPRPCVSSLLQMYFKSLSMSKLYELD